MRYFLKKAGVVPGKVEVIYSSEPPRVALLPLTEEQKAAPHEFGVVDNMRTRVIPVLGTSPAIMGQAMAAHVICSVAGQTFLPEYVPPLSNKAAKKYAEALARVSNQNTHSDPHVPTRPNPTQLDPTQPHPTPPDSAAREDGAQEPECDCRPAGHRVHRDADLAGQVRRDWRAHGARGRWRHGDHTLAA